MRKHRINTERIIVALMTGLLIMTAIAFRASAAEDAAEYSTDPYTGEPITWDVQGQGNEDAGEEEETLPELPEQTYSFGELAEEHRRNRSRSRQCILPSECLRWAGQKGTSG